MTLRKLFSRTMMIGVTACVALVGLACGGDGNSANGKSGTSTDSSIESTTTTMPSGFAGYVRTPRINVAQVSLPTVDGEEIKMVADPGGLRLLYFGFATCPDVCPATLGYVKMALAEQSQADRDRVQVDVVTIDPGRDTAEKWGAYVRQFVPDANVIRTDDPYLLRSAVNAFGADYRISIDEEGKKQVAHTDDLYAIDEAGDIVLAWPFGTAAPDIELDLRRLLAGERPTGDE